MWRYFQPASRCRSAPGPTPCCGRATLARIPATSSPARRSSSPPATSALATPAGPHAPDEYYVIESANPNVHGFDGAVMSFMEYGTRYIHLFRPVGSVSD